jgi:hypothetical protein
MTVRAARGRCRTWTAPRLGGRRTAAVERVRAGTGPRAPQPLAAISQLRFDTEGRAYYDRKIAEGKSSKEAIRALKRKISDRIFRHLIADAQRAATD